MSTKKNNKKKNKLKRQLKKIKARSKSGLGKSWRSLPGSSVMMRARFRMMTSFRQQDLWTPLEYWVLSSGMKVLSICRWRRKKSISTIWVPLKQWQILSSSEKAVKPGNWHRITVNSSLFSRNEDFVCCRR